MQDQFLNLQLRSCFTKKHFELTAVGRPFALKQLKCLKLKKVSGLDGLPARLLKDSAVVIADCVTHLVNLFIESGTVPSEWKQAKVVPLFKSGNKDDLDNYRPMSILPILSKILEKAVFHQLHSYLSEKLPPLAISISFSRKSFNSVGHYLLYR